MALGASDTRSPPHQLLPWPAWIPFCRRGRPVTLGPRAPDSRPQPLDRSSVRRDSPASETLGSLNRAGEDAGQQGQRPEGSRAAGAHPILTQPRNRPSCQPGQGHSRRRHQAWRQPPAASKSPDHQAQDSAAHSTGLSALADSTGGRLPSTSLGKFPISSGDPQPFSPCQPGKGPACARCQTQASLVPGEHTLSHSACVRPRHGEAHAVTGAARCQGTTG